jgi:hypothetical protein
MMRKKLIVSMLAVLVLTLSEVAAAADTDQNGQRRQTEQAADPAAGGATVSQHEWDYLTALQKCELRTGDEKTKCVDAARTNYGQM